jgi:hypothetical protein
MNELANWDELDEQATKSTIEQKMLEEAKRIYEQNPSAAIPTKHFKANYSKIFARTSSNPQPRLNKAMQKLASSGLVQVKKMSGKNYIRYVPVENAGKAPKRT